jgi:hypothetical protein
MQWKRQKKKLNLPVIKTLVAQAVFNTLSDRTIPVHIYQHCLKNIWRREWKINFRSVVCIKCKTMYDVQHECRAVNQSFLQVFGESRNRDIHAAIPPLSPVKMNNCVTKRERQREMLIVFPSSPDRLHFKAGSDSIVHHYFTDHNKHLCDRIFCTW